MNTPKNKRTEPPQKSEHWCPSACCEEGAVLLGIVGSNGVVGYISPQTFIDSNFVREVRKGRAPEKRFRFAQPCMESKCLNWSGERCNVIDTVLRECSGSNALESSEKFPKCTIRRSCRWFAQVGPEACAVCPLVITDTLETV